MKSLQKNPYSNKTRKITPAKRLIYEQVTKRAKGRCDYCHSPVQGARHHVVGRDIEETLENIVLLGGDFDKCDCHHDGEVLVRLKEVLQNYYISKYGEDDARLRMGGSLVPCNHNRQPWWINEWEEL